MSWSFNSDGTKSLEVVFPVRGEKQLCSLDTEFKRQTFKFVGLVFLSIIILNLEKYFRDVSLKHVFSFVNCIQFLSPSILLILYN